jgi:hypothetical protein
VTTEELILSELRELKKRLYGNGQPGDIALIRTEISALQQFKWKSLGAAGVIGAAVTLVLEALARGIFHG